METLTIETKKGKGRSFSANLLAWIEVPMLEPESGSAKRPPFMVLAAHSEEARFFNLNFLDGKPATNQHTSTQKLKFQLLKRGYAHHTVESGNGAVTTIYSPDLFWVDPGMVDPDIVQFIMLPSRQWLAKQKVDVEKGIAFIRKRDLTFYDHDYRQKKPIDDSEVEGLLKDALLFFAYLDRRIRVPLPPDPCFAMGLMVKCLNAKLAHRSRRTYARQPYTEHGFDRLGLPPGLFCYTSHNSIETIVQEEIRQWHV